MGKERVSGSKYRNKRCAEQGFSLIELIIAIAILVILTGLLAPQFLKYIEKSRRAVCMSAMDTLAGEYKVGLIELERAPSPESAALVLDKIMKQHKADRTETFQDSLVYLYEGVCKGGGEYRCELSKDLTAVTMECSRHGEWELDIVTLKKALDRLDFSSPDYENLPYKSLEQYFSEREGRIAINSEADGEKGYEGKFTSFAKAIEQQLGEQGINIKGKTWRLYKKGNIYSLTLAETKITKDNVGETVQCAKYDIKTGKIEHGSVKSVMQNGYPVIDGSTFVSSEK